MQGVEISIAEASVPFAWLLGDLVCVCVRAFESLFSFPGNESMSAEGRALKPVGTALSSFINTNETPGDCGICLLAQYPLSEPVPRYSGWG